jgi:hypothetical protein
MPIEPVDIVVKTEQGDPVEAVTVKSYSPSGNLFYTQGITDVDGVASFMLDTVAGGYSMRFYKFQVGFTQPQMFEVLPAPASNVFDVVAEVFHMPLSQDSRLCKCSGFFRDASGAPYAHLDIHIITEFDPILVDDNAVIDDEKHVQTDENGFVCVDLFRGANYYVNMEALGATMLRRLCRIPDAAGANFPDILFPVVETVTFDPVGPWTVPPDSELEVTPTVYDSVGRPLEGSARNDVLWGSSDGSVATVTALTDRLVIRGISAGSSQLTAARMDASIIKIPDIPIQGVPVDISV